jgi:chromosomal replication initiator protein
VLKAMSPNFPTTYPQADEAALEAQAHLDERLEVAAWRAVGETLSQRLSGHTYRTYVASARVLSSDVGLLRLGYATRFMLDMVRDHYRPLFEEELLRVANRRVAVELEIAEPLPEDPSAPPVLVEHLAPALLSRPATAIAPVRARVTVEPSGPGEPPPSRRGANGIDSKYTFESFVVGASNQFASAACKAVADGPGRTYNPLFLWGGSGLGKTHLMQAVGNKALADRPGLNIIYTSSEQFTNELITGIQTNKMHEFRRRYRECDLLLVDDVQFLAGKKATEEEFFHTFNALHSQNKQIIISSDTVPHEIDDMEERLRSRFQWGLIADVQPPEMETRVAILKTKAASMRLQLADDVTTFLATHIRQNVRELEGSLTRIAAFANLMKGPLTVDVCKDVLRSLLSNRGEKLDCEQVIKVCSEHFKVTVAEIKGPSRTKHLARARQAAMFLSRRLTGASFPEIGKRFGKKDHSTVIHAVQRVPELMAEDMDFRKSVETLERALSRSL